MFANIIVFPRVRRGAMEDTDLRRVVGFVERRTHTLKMPSPHYQRPHRVLEEPLDHEDPGRVHATILVSNLYHVVWEPYRRITDDS